MEEARTFTTLATGGGSGSAGGSGAASPAATTSFAVHGTVPGGRQLPASQAKSRALPETVRSPAAVPGATATSEAHVTVPSNSMRGPVSSPLFTDLGAVVGRKGPKASPSPPEATEKEVTCSGNASPGP